MAEYETFRIIYEIISTILCAVLVKFMIKPYQITRESRYLGLPLGFAFLGVTYALGALFYYQPSLFGRETLYVDLIVRVFAFAFLSVTYYFSKKSNENSKILWNTIFSLLIIAFIASFVIVSIPEILPNYNTLSVCTRVLTLILIGYICAHTLRSHLEKPDPETLWIPLGYFLLGISQYSLIIWAIDHSYAAFFGALAIRWAGLAVFLIISYRSFYTKKRLSNEKDRP
jgi:hypothetical protein